MLIPVTGHYEVCYSGTDPNGKPYTWAGPKVEAWDELGTPWIVPEKRSRQLVPADIHSNFSHVRRADSPIIAVIPGGDWRYETEWDAQTSSGPILAWLVHADGQVDPVDTDGEGCVSDILSLSNLKKIFHPEWEEPMPEKKKDPRDQKDPQVDDGVLADTEKRKDKK